MAKFKEVEEREDRQHPVCKCPSCGGKLYKFKDSGIGVKHCEDCQLGWHIIRTFRPKEKKVKEIDFQI